MSLFSDSFASALLTFGGEITNFGKELVILWSINDCSDIAQASVEV